jgi:hypothetical protein
MQSSQGHVRSLVDIADELKDKAQRWDGLDDEMARFDDVPLYGVESAIVGMIFGAVIARGASLDDCRRYLRAPHDDMPFVGSERDVLDQVIDMALDRGAERWQLFELLDMFADCVHLTAVRDADTALAGGAS